MPNACIHTDTYVWHELQEIMMTHWPSVCWLFRWMCHVTRRNESYTDERVTSHICVLSRHVFVSCESFTVHTHADECHMHISTSHVRHDSLTCAYGIWGIWYVHMAYEAFDMCIWHMTRYVHTHADVCHTHISTSHASHVNWCATERTGDRAKPRQITHVSICNATHANECETGRNGAHVQRGKIKYDTHAVRTCAYSRAKVCTGLFYRALLQRDL